MAVWMQNGCKRINYLPSWLCGSLGAIAHCQCPTSWVSYCFITSLGKDQNSENSFYWMHITFTPSESKNCKLNHLSVRNGLYSVPGTILNAFRALTYSILATERGGGYYYYPRFTDQETETDKMKSSAQGHVINKGQKRNCEYKVSGSWDHAEHFEHSVSRWTSSYSFLHVRGPLRNHSHTLIAKPRSRLARGSNSGVQTAFLNANSQTRVRLYGTMLLPTRSFYSPPSFLHRNKPLIVWS